MSSNLRPTIDDDDTRSDVTEDKEGRCSICWMQNETYTQKATVDPCFHSFHRSCLGTWISTQNPERDNCPYCRTPIEHIFHSFSPDGCQFQEGTVHNLRLDHILSSSQGSFGVVTPEPVAEPVVMEHLEEAILNVENPPLPDNSSDEEDADQETDSPNDHSGDEANIHEGIQISASLLLTSLQLMVPHPEQTSPLNDTQVHIQMNATQEQLESWQNLMLEAAADPLPHFAALTQALSAAQLTLTEHNASPDPEVSPEPNDAGDGNSDDEAEDAVSDDSNENELTESQEAEVDLGEGVDQDQEDHEVPVSLEHQYSSNSSDESPDGQDSGFVADDEMNFDEEF